MYLPLKVLVDLQLHGVNGASLTPARRGGAGPAYARAFLFDGNCVMLPVNSFEGAYQASCREGKYTLQGPLGTVEAGLVPQPKFYNLTTNDGIPYKKIALLHGNNCLASTVLQNCSRYADPSKRCRFCSIGTSLENGSTIPRKTPEQLAEVASAAKKLDCVTHVTLTSGSTRPRDKGIHYLGLCAEAITKASDLPVQLQFEPPEDFALFQELKERGVANVGMHVESLDEGVRSQVIPGKSELPLDYYFAAFEEAVRVLGRNHVSTYVILGLGEDMAVTREKCLELVRMGVYPNLVPLHHHPGTALFENKDVDREELLDLYTKVAREIASSGMSSQGNRAGCGRCGACSLLQVTERIQAEESRCALKKKGLDAQSGLSISVVTDPEEVEICHQIRRAVFCEEQHVFHGDDSDARDEHAVHILARINGEPAGVVRCFRRREGIWVGGRLAVLPKFRGMLGAKLVRKAVAEMKERGDVRRFFAVIQKQNVRFFTLLRWKPLGSIFICNGREHQIMEYPLGDTRTAK